jgi:hypothetical protein
MSWAWTGTTCFRPSRTTISTLWTGTVRTKSFLGHLDPSPFGPKHDGLPIPSTNYRCERITCCAIASPGRRSEYSKSWAFAASFPVARKLEATLLLEDRQVTRHVQTGRA